MAVETAWDCSQGHDVTGAGRTIAQQTAAFRRYERLTADDAQAIHRNLYRKPAALLKLPRVTLRCISAGDAFGREYHFDGTACNRISIGAGSGIVLDGQNPGREDCVIHRSDAGFLLIVPQSSRGVRVNGRAAECVQPLATEDTIQIGDMALLVGFSEAPDPSHQGRDLVEEGGLALFYEAVKRLVRRTGVGRETERPAASR